MFHHTTTVPPVAPELAGVPGVRVVHAAFADLDAIMDVEQRAYPIPWTRLNFADILAHPAQYAIQLLWDERLPDAPPSLIGYFVVMQGVQEAHLLNIAVHLVHDSVASSLSSGELLGCVLDVRNLPRIPQRGLDQLIVIGSPIRTNREAGQNSMVCRRCGTDSQLIDDRLIQAVPVSSVFVAVVLRHCNEVSLSVDVKAQLISDRAK